MLAFTFLCITAPILGAIASGFIANWCGGYESKIILPVAMSFGLVGGIIGMFEPFTDNFYIAVTILWIDLFAGGILAPILTGVSLASVEPELRTQSYSIANAVYNLIGYIPAPYLYGYIQ